MLFAVVKLGLSTVGKELGRQIKVKLIFTLLQPECCCAFQLYITLK